MTSTQAQNPLQVILNQLTVIQQITLKAFKAKTSQNLNFIILNDTYHVMPYDLAGLWKINSNGSTLLGVSGQTTYTTQSDIVQHWKDTLTDLKESGTYKVLSTEDFPHLKENWKKSKTNENSSVLWLPIIRQGQETIGLWLEKWEDPQGVIFKNNMKIIDAHLIPGYAVAWENLNPTSWYKRFKKYFNRKTLSFLLPFIVLLFLLIRVPLRIVAPCEVVPKDFYIVTAPLNGIIAKVDVKPGQQIKQGEALYEYDPRVPTQELKIAEKQVLLMNAEINRATAVSVEEHQSSGDLATGNIKLQKAELDLAFAQNNFKELTGKAPISGVALIDNPDEWQGKPVKLGEKILLIANPDQTKVRMWIPESDNIQIDKTIPVRIYLNPNPEINYYVKLNFISHEANLTDKHISSFEAEGEWIGEDNKAKLGVKGSAVLYGEKVSLLYYILRKPLSTLREFTGL